MSSLFFLNVGKTGSGKEHANTVIERLLEASGLIGLRGPNGYTSEGGVLSALHDKPTHIAIIDEFGMMLESAGKAGNHNKKEALSMMMEAFGRQTSTLRNKGFSTASMNAAQKKAMKIEIKNPSLTVLGMTTPETFYEAIKAKDVASGFLNRILIVESKRPREKARTPERIDPPDAVIDWAKAVASAAAGDAGNLQDNGAEFPPEPILVNFTPDALAMLSDFEDVLNERQDGMQQAALASMLNRSREIAMRLSLIVSRSLGEYEISGDAMQWAIAYVDNYATQTLDAMGIHMAEGDIDALRKRTAEAVREAGLVGLKMGELIKAVPALGNLRKFDRDGLLKMLIEDFPIERLASAPEGGRGRPSIIHRWIE